MYKLLYFYDGRLSESYEFPTKALCQWQVNQFTKLGTHIYGHFVIQKYENTTIETMLFNR